MLGATHRPSPVLTTEDVIENFFVRIQDYVSKEEPGSIEQIRGVLLHVIEVLQPSKSEMWKLQLAGEEAQASFKLIAYSQLATRCNTVLAFMDKPTKRMEYNAIEFLNGILALRPSVTRIK